MACAAPERGALARLLAVMAALRRRCPWDREQTFRSIAPFTVEEAYEVADAIERQDWPGLKEELGDLLFSAVNLARHLDVDPEAALARTNRKFEARFRHIETRLAAQGRSTEDASLEEMERLWNEAKLNPPAPSS